MGLRRRPGPTAEVLVTATRTAGPDTGDHGQHEASPKWGFLKEKHGQGFGGKNSWSPLYGIIWGFV